ncbi:MAG: hypothetical protein IT307_09220 [Chloroflexi bacterium]|nr:hypothetical protein [Chloroflexota bacterium]
MTGNDRAPHGQKAKALEPWQYPEDRTRLAAQTDRNMAGLALESAGQPRDAIAIYELNVDEGFEGDWPYGRLVAIYERRGELEQAERVLLKAMDVFRGSKRRTAADRRVAIRAFRGRLKLVRQAIRQRDKRERPPTLQPPGA